MNLYKCSWLQMWNDHGCMRVWAHEAEGGYQGSMLGKGTETWAQSQRNPETLCICVHMYVHIWACVCVCVCVYVCVCACAYVCVCVCVCVCICMCMRACVCVYITLAYLALKSQRQVVRGKCSAGDFIRCLQLIVPTGQVEVTVNIHSCLFQSFLYFLCHMLVFKTWLLGERESQL